MQAHEADLMVQAQQNRDSGHLRMGRGAAVQRPNCAEFLRGSSCPRKTPTPSVTHAPSRWHRPSKPSRQP